MDCFMPTVQRGLVHCLNTDLRAMHQLCHWAGPESIHLVPGGASYRFWHLFILNENGFFEC